LVFNARGFYKRHAKKIVERAAFHDETRFADGIFESNDFPLKTPGSRVFSLFVRLPNSFAHARFRPAY
jgi:uncharacterized protein YozE (UPF0346 family)